MIAIYVGVIIVVLSFGAIAVSRIPRQLKRYEDMLDNMDRNDPDAL